MDEAIASPMGQEIKRKLSLPGKPCTVWEMNLIAHDDEHKPMKATECIPHCKPYPKGSIMDMLANENGVFEAEKSVHQEFEYIRQWTLYGQHLLVEWTDEDLIKQTELKYLAKIWNMSGKAMD
jgi:hypothetical protein